MLREADLTRVRMYPPTGVMSPNHITSSFVRSDSQERPVACRCEEREVRVSAVASLWVNVNTAETLSVLFQG